MDPPHILGCFHRNGFSVLFCTLCHMRIRSGWQDQIAHSLRPGRRMEGIPQWHQTTILKNKEHRCNLAQAQATNNNGIVEGSGS